MSAQQHRASRCVFVGNIPYDATEEQLVQICEEVGPVVSFRLVVDRDTGKPKGYGFCEFRDEETALSARRNLQGYDINGRQLRVDFAENEKGGGGLDRNREQGRGGPGYQQNSSHLDIQKQGGGGSHQSGFGGGGGATTLEPPIGRAAASAAALVMAGALGGAQQQLPNMMMQGQGPMQPMSAASSPVTGTAGVPAGTDAMTNHLASMSKQQLYEIMAQMKNMVQQNQLQVRQILVANPQLTKALFQAQIMLGMVRPPQVATSQAPQAQQLPPQQPVMQQQQQLQAPPPPRPLQPLAPPPMQMQQQPNKNNFPPPLPQPQQQALQQPQALPPQQQQQLPPPPPPQGPFQVGMTQTSLGMGFAQGPPPQAPNQPPPQQLYQMGSSMMTGSLSRMGTNAGGGGPVGQGNGGMLSGTGAMGSVQMPRGPALSGGLGSLDARGVQLGHGHPPSSAGIGGMSGVHGQGHMPGVGHSMVGAAGGGTTGLGQSLPNNLTGPQMMGDHSGRGYAGLNPGLSAQMNSGMNPNLNSNLNASMNAGMNAPLNSGMNVGMNTGMPPGLNQGYNAGMNQALNAGLHSNMNMNPGLTMGLNASQGGFSGAADGTPVSTAALQSQVYPQGGQQSQGQVPLELEQQKALLQQVMNLTTEQIMSLPPDQRQQVLQLQQALR